MGSLYRRGEVWWGYWRDALGEKHRESLATGDREVARQRLRARELATPDSIANATPLGEALTYLVDTVYAGRPDGTVRCYQQKARWLAELLGAERPLGSIDRALVLGYRARRLESRVSESTVAKELLVLRLALREQGIEGVVPRLPVRYVPRKRFLTAKQFARLLAELPVKRRLWLMVATYLGPRYSELVDRLRWEDIDLRRRLAHIRGTKTVDADRTVPIPAPLLPWLRRARQDAGQVVEAWTNARRDICAAWWKVVGFKPPAGWMRGKISIAGAPRLSPNDLRRTFASWLKQAGVDSLAVAHLLGHSSTRMVELVYGRLDERTYRDAVAMLPPAPPARAGRKARKRSTSRRGDSDCAPVVNARGGKRSSTETRDTSKVALGARKRVPRVGIEPTTRGFSGPVLQVVDGGITEECPRRAAAVHRM